jgi:hypothetical protein
MASDISVNELLQVLSEKSSAEITLSQLCRFVALASTLRNDIILTQPSTSSVLEPPDYLPPSVITFLQDS